jgi:hypothetical protein
MAERDAENGKLVHSDMPVARGRFARLDVPSALLFELRNRNDTDVRRWQWGEL